MKVTDPRGVTWRVTRRWVPWRRRVKNVDGAPETGAGNLGDDPISMVVGVVMLVVLIPFLVVALVAALELLLLLLLLPLAVLGRVALGHHWVIEARVGFTPAWEGTAVGWSRSAERIAEVADALHRGLGLPDDGRRL